MIKRCISSIFALPMPWSFALSCSFLHDKWCLIHVIHAVSFSFPSLPLTLDLKASSLTVEAHVGSIPGFYPSGGRGFASLCSCGLLLATEGPFSPPPFIFHHPHWWFCWCLQYMGCGRSGRPGACAQSRVAVALGPGAGSVCSPSMEARAVEGPRCKPNSAI